MRQSRHDAFNICLNCSFSVFYINLRNGD